MTYIYEDPAPIDFSDIDPTKTYWVDEDDNVFDSYDTMQEYWAAYYADNYGLLDDAMSDFVAPAMEEAREMLGSDIINEFE